MLEQRGGHLTTRKCPTESAECSCVLIAEVDPQMVCLDLWVVVLHRLAACTHQSNALIFKEICLEHFGKGAEFQVWCPSNSHFHRQSTLSSTTSTIKYTHFIPFCCLPKLLQLITLSDSTCFAARLNGRSQHGQGYGNYTSCRCRGITEVLLYDLYGSSALRDGAAEDFAFGKPICNDTLILLPEKSFGLWDSGWWWKRPAFVNLSLDYIHIRNYIFSWHLCPFLVQQIVLGISYWAAAVRLSCRLLLWLPKFSDGNIDWNAAEDRILDGYSYLVYSFLFMAVSWGFGQVQWCT